jgi:quinol monooxygenase YgiN
MVQIMVDMKVKDFGQWKRGFGAGSDLRKNNGSKGSRILQDAGDPNHVVAILSWDDAARAKAFFQSPDLMARQQEAGVVGQPATTFLDESGTMDA